MRKFVFCLLAALLCLTAGCSRKETAVTETIASEDPLVGSWHTVGLYYEGDIFTAAQMEAMEVLTDITIELTSNHHFNGVFRAEEKEAVNGLWAEESLDGFNHVYVMSLGAAMILNNENPDVMYFGFADNEGDLMLILNRDGTNNHQKTVVNDEEMYAIALSIVGSTDKEADCSDSEFTNEYGTATTICKHNGCYDYIAPSGNTNCCIEHSAYCLNCGCYIDEDSVYCMNCLTQSINSRKERSNSSNKVTKGCQYEYSDGSVCGSRCIDYTSLCNEHFEQLYSIYESLT